MKYPERRRRLGDAARQRGRGQRHRVEEGEHLLGLGAHAGVFRASTAHGARIVDWTAGNQQPHTRFSQSCQTSHPDGRTMTAITRKGEHSHD